MLKYISQALSDEQFALNYHCFIEIYAIIMYNMKLNMISIEGFVSKWSENYFMLSEVSFSIEVPGFSLTSRTPFFFNLLTPSTKYQYRQQPGLVFWGVRVRQHTITH